LTALLLSSLLFNPVYSQINEWEWSVQSVSEEANYSTDLAFDDFNNIYFSGIFYGNSFQIGDSVFHSQEGRCSSYIAGFNKKGNFRWAMCLQKEETGTFGFVDGCHLAVDSQQNLYVAGEFDFTVDFGDTVLNSYGNWDIFIAKFDSSGHKLWVYQIGGPTDDQFEDLKIDIHDNLYLSVNHSRPGFENTVIYGNNDTTLIFQNYCAAILSLQPDASFSWITYGTGEYNEVRAENLILYENRHLFAQFQLFGEFHFDGQDIEADLEPITHMIVPIDETGNPGNYIKFPQYWIADMLMDSQSNIYSCGVFNQPIIILGDTLEPVDFYDFLMVKYNYLMEPLWYITFPNNSNMLDIKMAADWDNGILLSTPFLDEVVVADTVLQSESESALFIAKLNPSGHVTGAEIIPGSGFLYCSSLKLDHCRNMILGGGYIGEICLGNDTITAEGSSGEVFMAKFIRESSYIDLGNDTLIFINDSLVLEISAPAASIDWSDGSSGEADFTFKAKDYGEGYHEIWVHVEDVNGCYDRDTITIQVIDNSRIDEQGSMITSLYPNPAHEKLYLQLRSSSKRDYQNLTLEIMDIKGQILFNKSLSTSSENSDHECVIDISSFGNDMYFLLLKDDRKVVEVSRFIKIE
jgi:hypothetical protein